MKSRLFIPFVLSASILVGVGAGALVSQVAAPTETDPDATAITGVGSGVEGAGAKQTTLDAPQATATARVAEVFTPNQGSMQSIRGIKGIDTVTLQNLEAVLRMTAPPLPPADGGGARAAALSTMESDQPPDPEAEPDGREELNEFELEGS